MSLAHICRVRFGCASAGGESMSGQGSAGVASKLRPYMYGEGAQMATAMRSSRQEPKQPSFGRRSSYLTAMRSHA